MVEWSHSFHEIFPEKPRKYPVFLRFGFGIDTTIAYDVPGAQPQEYITELGKGTAIKIMDSGTV